MLRRFAAAGLTRDAVTRFAGNLLRGSGVAQGRSPRAGGVTARLLGGELCKAQAQQDPYRAGGDQDREETQCSAQDHRRQARPKRSLMGRGRRSRRR